MKRQLMTLLIASAFATLAFAQQQGSQTQAQAKSLPSFADVDGNDDGKIDMAEAKMLTKSLEETKSTAKFDFKTADANEDGAVDAAEYKKYEEDMKS
jgi:hypothetical protein